MKIGVPKEIKDQEGRVAMTPAGARRFAEAGHTVCIESGAGSGSGFADQEYLDAGARLGDAAAAWDNELVLKVKEPLESEYGYLQGQMLFTYLHLAGVTRTLTEVLLRQGTTAIAYETLEDSAGRLLLLAPMSAIAGNMAASIGAYYLARTQGGKGVQLGEVLGVRHGRVLIVGDGTVAQHAAQSAYGLGAQVAVAGLDPAKGETLRGKTGKDLEFFLSTPEAVAAHVKEADLVIGAVLRHGARADFVVTEAMVKTLAPGSVVVDVSIDQGGCIATSRPTSHSHPTYQLHGVTHYCVTNMPGAYPRTSTLALTEAVLPYALRLASRGLQAMKGDEGFGKALNACQGWITYKPVAEALGLMERYRAYSDL
ncbi:alanine dehydrogenase [Methylogaea oryzae]|uniref:Alanine dehydrogenase n=1 Tax=Methylogaea oryzae TaxID=1295382 RepID=A0A8D4VS62_9GAMM|nr:alanine dehydrogenase [Methylogaea oryzae]BBL71380.1 alanine dehydrogenase [Methylogaea oryzae]